MKRAVGYLDYQPLLDAFVSLIQETLGDQLVSVVLYGSVARGTARPESDADLLIILRDASAVYRERLQPFLVILRQLEEEVAWKELEAKGLRPYLSLLVLSKEEAEQTRYIYLDMIDEAQVLVDSEGFLGTNLRPCKSGWMDLGLSGFGRKRVGTGI